MNLVFHISEDGSKIEGEQMIILNQSSKSEVKMY